MMGIFRMVADFRCTSFVPFGQINISNPPLFWRCAMKARRTATTTVLVASIVGIVLVAGAVYIALTPQLAPVPMNSPSKSNTRSIASSSQSSWTDKFLTKCVVTGAGGLQLQVVSDSNGVAVSGATINATDNLGCNIIGQTAETQVVHVVTFEIRAGGWLTPVFPNQATPAGELNLTVSYEGATYDFLVQVPPLGVSCVTLHVPSGNVTRLTTTGQCS
jgi:hypothetical protein